MLKEDICVFSKNIGVCIVESIHEAVKEYFLLYVLYKINNVELSYRGKELKIHDKDGYKDAMTIERDLQRQVLDINKELDGE